MESLKRQFEEVITELSVPQEGTQEAPAVVDEELKKLKKKLKKNFVEPKEASLPEAVQKLKKMTEYLYKCYESAAKARTLMVTTVENKNNLNAELDKAIDQKKLFQNLHSTFMKKYQDQIKQAQDYENQGQVNRTKLIQQLQARVKSIQDQYEESGKAKIQKLRENEITKNQLQRLEPHVTTSEALIDAQLKKRSIEIEIEMTTLKQKIEMIENYKKLGDQTKGKLQKSKTDSEKIAKRVAILDKQDEQHKMSIAKAHLAIDEYKKVMHNIRQVWQKSEKEAMGLRQKLMKSQEALRSKTDEETKLKKELQTQKGQLQGLRNLEKNLTEQLKNM